MKLFALLSLCTLSLNAATISGTTTPTGTTVQAYDAAGSLKASASTDAAGHYNLTVAPGKYRVLAFDLNGFYATSFYPDAESFETSLLLDVQANAGNINFTLARGGVAGGTVTSTSGAPLPSMTVAAYNPDGTRRGFTTTDAEGTYRLVLPPGTYDLAAYDDALAYVPSVVSGHSVVAAQTTTVDFRLTHSAVVTGTITDASSHTAVAGAAVSLYANGVLTTTATADTGGRYRIVVAPATIRLVAFDPAGNFAPSYFSNAESFDTSREVSLAEAETATIDVQLVRAAKFSGHVIDAVTRAPIAGITVAAYNDDGTTRAFTTTDNGGAYVLVVAPGVYRVAAFDPLQRYARRFYPNATTFAAAPSWGAFASQTTALDLALPRGATVSGQVTTSGATAAGITVAAYDGTGLAASTLTDASGAYRLFVDAGTYTLAAFDTAFRYATATIVVTTSAGQSLGNQNLSLVSGAHLSGRVTSASGVPLAAMTVGAYDEAGTLLASAISRGDGTFDLVVPSGTYRFAAFDPLLRYAPSPPMPPLAVTGGQTVTGLVFTLPANAAAHRRAARH